MRGSGSRFWAVVEVGGVFVITLAAVCAVSMSPLGQWQRAHLGRAFFSYLVMIAVPLLLLAAARRGLTAYGIWLGDIRYQWEVAWRCGLVFTATQLILFPFGRDLGPMRALVRAALAIVALWLFALLTKRQPTAAGPGVLVGALLLLQAMPQGDWTTGHALSALVFFPFVLGPGEEILFQGYIQSRLNRAFGRPFLLFGVRCGWSLVITSLLFATFHALNLSSLARWELHPRYWLGASSFFWGVTFGWLREKTGSVAAPAFVHGVPQALVAIILGR